MPCRKTPPDWIVDARTESQKGEAQSGSLSHDPKISRARRYLQVGLGGAMGVRVSK